MRSTLSMRSRLARCPRRNRHAYKARSSRAANPWPPWTSCGRYSSTWARRNSTWLIPPNRFGTFSAMLASKSVPTSTALCGAITLLSAREGRRMSSADQSRRCPITMLSWGHCVSTCACRLMQLSSNRSSSHRNFTNAPLACSKHACRLRAKPNRTGLRV
ncbi:hypothetical protein D3C78_1109840 [compost metagenome]